VYREDADVAWRAQLLGWRCIYTPGQGLSRAQSAAGQPPGAATGHQHALGEEPVPDAHQEHDGDLYWRNWLSIAFRDALVIGCCLLREHTSLKAFWLLAKNWRRFLVKRQAIMQRRRVDDEYMAAGSATSR